MFIASRGAIDLDELCEIYSVAKSRFDGRLVRNESVSCDLDLGAKR